MHLVRRSREEGLATTAGRSAAAKPEAQSGEEASTSLGEEKASASAKEAAVLMYLNWKGLMRRESKSEVTSSPIHSSCQNTKGGKRFYLDCTRDTGRGKALCCFYFCISLISYNSHHNSRAQSRETVPAPRP